MRFEFTIATPAGDQDVAITAPPGTRADSLRTAIADAAVRCGVKLRSHIGVPRTGAVVGADGARAPDLERGMTLFVAGGPCAGQVHQLRPGQFVLGRARDCDLTLDDESVSRHHVELTVGRRELTVRDLASTNGCELDGVRLSDTPVEFRPGQLLRLGNTLVGLRHGVQEQRATLIERGDVMLFSPCRRLSSVPPDRTIEFPEPTGRRSHPRLALAGALVPAAFGGLIALLTGSPEFLLFAAMSPVLVLSTALGERLRRRRAHRRTTRANRRARDAALAEIADALAAERAYWRTAFPGPAELERIATVPSPRLWERGPADADFLRVRLGTARLPARVSVRSGGTERPAASIAAMPVCVDLRAGPLGVGGPACASAAVARHLIGQLAVLHSPKAVRLALVVPRSEVSWHWARWLPHLDGRVARDPDETDRLAAALTKQAEPAASAVVVLVDAAETAREQLRAVASLEPQCCLVYLAQDASQLPAQCRQVVTLAGPTGSRAVLRCAREHGQTPLEFAADQVDSAWAERVARAIAPLRDGTSPADERETCPPLCDLLDIGAPDPERIVARWATAEHHPMTVLGVAGETSVWVDLAVDGPHALVAGTTGAGKSELLRTLVTGLALSLPPNQVSFLLIDYKGGASFADCAQLPHTAGLVTDLDAQLTRRALRSLDAELRRREVVLASAGAADIDAFHRLEPTQALPRLIVIIDEFATLAEELPDFVKGLIGVAQRGRSLGVHLVLATQRPGRAVTPEIKANTSLRIALRVTDAAESLDILDAPDAAAIPQDSAGVAYVRRGDQLTRFRTALAQPGTAQEVRVELLDRWRRRGANGDDRPGDESLRTIVAAIRDAAARTGIEGAHSPWLPPLPARLAHPRGSPRPGVVELGLVDLPDQQMQASLVIDLAEPTALLACGTNRSGRTGLLLATALRAAEAASPADLEIYIIERDTALRSALGCLPHVASAVSAGEDPGLADALLRRLAVASRAHRLLLVDDWDAVLAAAGEAGAGHLTEQFAHLIRIALGRGVTILVTGDRSLLTARWATSVSTRLVLRLGDRADYVLAGVAARDMPTALPPGRGVRVQDGAQFQLFTAASSSDLPDEGVVDEVAAIATRWSTAPTSRTAIRLRRIPERVGLDRCGTPPTGLRLGIGGDLAAPVAIDPFSGSCLIIAGPPRSGRSTALLTILLECDRTGVRVVLAAPSRSPLHEHASRIGVRVIGCGDAAEAVGAPPDPPALLLVDDCAAFDDTAAGERLAFWLRRRDPGLGATVAGRTDELISAYRGLGAQARRDRCGLLLRPTPLDGELLGMRLDRGHQAGGPPGRGLLIGVRCWTAPEAGAGRDADWALVDPSVPLPVQIAAPWGADPAAVDPGQPPAMCGYR
jgi:DNA segregation ATPase FtsK/SpoIIIE, S-DNA-T family